VATSANAVSALTGLTHYVGVSSPDLLNLFNAADALSLGTSEASNRAGAKLSPLSTAKSASGAASAPTLEVLNLLALRTDSLRLASADVGGMSKAGGSPKFGVWGQTFGGHASQGASGDVDGYSANYAGLLFGADAPIGKDWIAGGAFSYANTAVNNTGMTAGDSTRIITLTPRRFALQVLKNGIVCREHVGSRCAGRQNVGGVLNQSTLATVAPGLEYACGRSDGKKNESPSSRM
jgi:uncharacterized protein with beta-barrel porin domain